MRPKRPITLVSRAWWNGLVDFYFRHRILELNILEPEPWRHPWFTRVRWDGVSEQWRATISPGYCLSPTGEPVPRVSLAQRLAPAETLARLGLQAEGETRVECYLDEAPAIPLPAGIFRAIGTDARAVAGGEVESVPEFFADRGVVGPAVLDTSGESAVVRVEGLVAARARASLLRACDLVLYHDRLATTVARSISADEVTFDLILRRLDQPRGPRIEVVRDYQTEAARDAAAVLLGAQTDPGRDGLHLATVYLLSPAGAPEGSTPDATWQPYVRHRAFWNLQYVTRSGEDVVEPTRVAVPVPQLGLGQLGAAAAIFTEAINRNLAQLEAALRRVENSGIFYMA